MHSHTSNSFRDIARGQIASPPPKKKRRKKKKRSLDGVKPPFLSFDKYFHLDIVRDLIFFLHLTDWW